MIEKTALPVYRASGLYSCRKKLAATRLNLQKLPEPEFLQIAATEGTYHEKIIKQGLPKVWAEQELVEIWDDSLPFIIQGHIDGKTQDDDGSEMRLAAAEAAFE